MIIIMFGAPGAGKGTQAGMISDYYGIPAISTGDIFRWNMKNNTDLGKKVKKYMDGGNLVPDDLTCELVKDRISQDDCKNGFILDGFPRTIPQAETLEEILKASSRRLDLVIDIEVDDEHIIHRMEGRRACPECRRVYHTVANPPKTEGICDHCGSKLIIREDDNPDTVKNRLGVYHDQTQPLKDFYRNNHSIEVVDGTKPMEEIFEILKAVIGER